MPNSRTVGISSSSGSRLHREYSVCRAEIGADAVAMEEAAMAVRLQQVEIGTKTLAPARRGSGGDVVASAA